MLSLYYLPVGWLRFGATEHISERKRNILHICEILAKHKLTTKLSMKCIKDFFLCWLSVTF